MPTYDMIEENVPEFKGRVGDHVQHGSNNTVFIMGRDRAKYGPASFSDGLGHEKALGGGKNAGVFHLIAGMSDKNGNPDMKDDKAFFYLSMKTDADKNLNVVSSGDSGINAAALLKSDVLRFVARKDIKITLDNSKGYIKINSESIEIVLGNSKTTLFSDKTVINSGRIELGKDANENIILGKSFAKFFDDHKHPLTSVPVAVLSVPTPTGPGQGTIISGFTETPAQKSLDKHLSDQSYVKKSP